MEIWVLRYANCFYTKPLIGMANESTYSKHTLIRYGYSSSYFYQEVYSILRSIITKIQYKFSFLQKILDLKIRRTLTKFYWSIEKTKATFFNWLWFKVINFLLHKTFKVSYIL